MLVKLGTTHQIFFGIQFVLIKPKECEYIILIFDYINHKFTFNRSYGKNAFRLCIEKYRWGNIVLLKHELLGQFIIVITHG